MKEKNYDSLPKWVQSKIRVLKSDVEYYKNKVKEIDGESETNVFIQNPLDKPIPLPKDSTIIFKSKENLPLYSQITVRIIEEGIIEVCSCGSDVKILPRACNVVYVNNKREV